MQLEEFTEFARKVENYERQQPNTYLNKRSRYMADKGFSFLTNEKYEIQVNSIILCESPLVYVRRRIRY